MRERYLVLFFERESRRERDEEGGGRRGELAYLTFHVLFPSFSFFYLAGWMMTI